MDRFSDRGSTPLISTKSRRHPMRVPSAFELIGRESNGSVVNACRWHAEPTPTEPAGENSTPRRALAAISTIAEPVEPKG